MNAKNLPGFVLIFIVFALALTVNILTAPAQVVEPLAEGLYIVNGITCGDGVENEDCAADTWYAPGMESIYNPCQDGEESEKCEHKTPPVVVFEDGSTSAGDCLSGGLCEFDAFAPHWTPLYCGGDSDCAAMVAMMTAYHWNIGDGHIAVYTAAFMLDSAARPHYPRMFAYWQEAFERVEYP